MPSVSKAQQHLFGAVLAHKRGENPGASDEVKRMASEMTEQQLKDFAATKTEGLPEHAKAATGIALAMKRAALPLQQPVNLIAPAPMGDVIHGGSPMSGPAANAYQQSITRMAGNVPTMNNPIASPQQMSEFREEDNAAFNPNSIQDRMRMRNIPGGGASGVAMAPASNFKFAQTALTLAMAGKQLQ